MVLKTPLNRRGYWVAEEDQILLQLVHEHGHKWAHISQRMHYRSPKQCRDRFHTKLKPSLSHEPISAEEGLMIEKMVIEIGKRWAEIARRLGNRSDNAVKKWWNHSMNRKRQSLSNAPSSMRLLISPVDICTHLRTCRSRAASIHVPGDSHTRFPDTSLFSPTGIAAKRRWTGFQPTSASWHRSVEDLAIQKLSDSAKSSFDTRMHLINILN